MLSRVSCESITRNIARSRGSVGVSVSLGGCTCGWSAFTPLNVTILARAFCVLAVFFLLSERVNSRFLAGLVV